MVPAESSHAAPAPAGLFRRVLVGYDRSDQARHAFRTARALAAEVSGDVHVLVAVRPTVHAETDDQRLRDAEEQARLLSRGLLEDQAGGAGSRVPVTTNVVLADEPARALADYAEEHGIDVIVVGSHGREQVTHRGIGQSLAALVVHHPCPVLVV